jgi:hypothetical protein
MGAHPITQEKEDKTMIKGECICPEWGTHYCGWVFPIKEKED